MAKASVGVMLVVTSSVETAVDDIFSTSVGGWEVGISAQINLGVKKKLI